MRTVEDLEIEISKVKEKMSKHEPNSIMGVHYSSKLASLQRQLRKQFFSVKIRLTRGETE